MNKENKTKENSQSEINKTETAKFTIKVGFISLGCDKNRVDTEKMITDYSKYSIFSFVHNKEDADVILINTCAFLNTSREEATNTILEMSELKNKNLKKLIVAGCLPMLVKENLKEQFPFVDKFVTPENYTNIAKITLSLFDSDISTKPNKKINANLKLKNTKNSNKNIEDINNLENLEEIRKIDLTTIKEDKDISARMLTTPPHYAYLKIADGCSNFCSFCKIPYIRGKYTSIPMEEILKEAQSLAEKGTKEIILVAQDVTRYGMDLYKEYKLVELLKKLATIKKLSWIRLLYCYPDRIDDELIREIKNNHKIVKYIDIPMQHVSNNILRTMKRHNTKAEAENLIKKLREKIPDIKIRSTFMVGFPTETKKDFKELCKFLTDYKLDNVGFFKYSREEGTLSYNLEGQIDEEEKDKRLAVVQKLQEKIANANNKKHIGEIYKVIIDSFNSKHNYFVGRPYFSAPDVDFEILFTSFSKLTKVGSFADVKITGFEQGFFIGEVFYNEDNNT